MDWDSEALPLLRAVAQALKENDGEAVSDDRVNALLEQPLEEARLDRRLGELHKSGLIEGPTINERAAPVWISLTVRGRQLVSGWPTEERGGGVSISGSTIGNLALRDITVNNLSVANFFEAWEQQVEELDAPPEEKREAREKLRMAKEVVTGAAGSAGGRLIYDAFPLLFG